MVCVEKGIQPSLLHGFLEPKKPLGAVLCTDCSLWSPRVGQTGPPTAVSTQDNGMRGKTEDPAPHMPQCQDGFGPGELGNVSSTMAQMAAS